MKGEAVRRTRTSGSDPLGRRLVMLFLLAACICARSSLADNGRYVFNIPSQSVSSALNEYARITGAKILFPFDVLVDASANKVSGEYQAGEALELLLEDTGFSSSVSDKGNIIIRANNLTGELPMKKKRGLLASLVALVSASGAELATAQSQATEPVKSIEEVIVSATKRAESIQDVPVSVVAMSEMTLKKVGIGNVADLATYIPNFEFASNSIQTNVYIRGIGSGPTHAIEQSVGRFVDDVYIGRADMNNIGFMDLASVEVLRGPQGTLFGKNTVAGALIINTNNPTEEFEGGFSASYGNWSTVNDYKEIQAYSSGPLNDRLRARLAAKWRDDGGFVENVLDGPDAVARRDIGARLKLDYDLTDNTLVRLKADFHNLESDGQPLGEQSIPSPDPAQRARILSFLPASAEPLNWQYGFDCGREIIADLGSEQVNQGTFCPFKDQNTYTLAVTVEHEIEGVGTITSISAQQHYDWDETFGSVDNGVSGGVFRAIRAEEYDGFSQEIRLTSGPFDAYDYIVGLYYEDSTVERFQRSNFGFVDWLNNPGAPFLTRNQPWEQDTETFALFGQVRINVSEALQVTLGGRYSDETKDFIFDQFWNVYNTLEPLAGPPTFSRDETGSEDDFSPSVQLSWDLNEEVMLFLNWSEGYKAGGFSDRLSGPTSPIAYDAETNTTIEAGVKATLLDGSLVANITYFNMDIQDMQVASIVPGSAGDFVVGNAAEATSQGLEAELTWYASDNLEFGANFAYTDATFDTFGGECGSVPVNLQPNGTCSYAGFNLPYAPETKGSVYGDITFPTSIAGWDLSIRGIFSFSDDYFTNPTFEEGEIQDSYTKIDATVQLQSPGGNHRLTLVGRNLTEEEILDWSILVGAGPSYFSALKPPREIALTYAVDF